MWDSWPSAINGDSAASSCLTPLSLLSAEKSLQSNTSAFELSTVQQQATSAGKSIEELASLTSSLVLSTSFSILFRPLLVTMSISYGKIC